MKQPFKDDKDILEALQSKAPLRVNAALKHLYQRDKLKNAVRQQVYTLGGDSNDSREALNQALIIFLNHVEDEKYDPALSRINTYIVKIASQLYYTRRRSETRRVKMYDRSLETAEIDLVTNPEVEMNRLHRKELLDKILAFTGEKCQKALQLHSFSFSMIEIAEKLSYKSADVAKMALMDCRKKLNKFLAEHPELLAELREL